MDRPVAGVHRPQSLAPRRTCADDHQPAPAPTRHPIGPSPRPRRQPAARRRDRPCHRGPGLGTADRRHAAGSARRWARARPADGPIRGSRRARRRPDPVHGRRARDRAVRATCVGPLDGGRRVAAQPARRATVRSRDPRRRRPPTLRSEGIGEQRDDRTERPGRHALGRPAVCSEGGPGRRGRSGRSSSGGVRVPAVLGADRPFDQARLADALDHRLLRGRGRRQRRSPAQELGRIDDRGVERLDELEADRDHQYRSRQWHPRRADRPELRLVVVGGDPPEGPARERDRPRQPRPPDRGGGAGSRRGWRQPRLRADRIELRRRVHRARPVGPRRAQQGRQGVPADVRHDRLDRQLPDRGRHGSRGGRRRRRHGLRLPRRVLEPGRLGRADRRPVVRHRRHGQGVSRSRTRVEGHPRGAVLRPRLVDRQRRRSTPGTSRGRRTAGR